MASTDAPTSVAPPVPARRRRRRWYALLAVTVLLIGGLSACEGWAAWREQRAAQALAESRLDEANRLIDQALWVRRRRTSTLLLAARIRRLSGRDAEAEELLNRCGQLHGMSEPLQLEWLLLRCQKDEVDALAPPLNALVRQGHPQSAAILETLASVYIRQTRYLEAQDCLDRWLEREPDSLRGLDWHGWVGAQLDFRQQSISDYERLLKLRPERSDIRLRLAQVYVASSRHRDAVTHLERLLAESPNDPDVLVALASCRVAQSRRDEARTLLDGVLSERPDHFEALNQRGQLEITEGHYAEAERWLRKALQVKPHEVEVRYALCMSLEFQPHRQSEAERERTLWKQVREKQRRLVTLLREDLARNPNNVELAREAGELLLDVGKDKRGLFWLYRALALNPRHRPTRQVLLAYYQRTNQPDKADEQRRELAKSKPRP